MTRGFRHSLLLCPLLAAAGLGSVAQADVKVVASDGNGGFLTIQAAVDAAVDGDVVLVRPGTYSSFEIVDLSLTVTAEIGTRVAVDGSVRVRDLAAERSVLLVQLDVRGNFQGPLGIGHGLRAQNCQGSLRAQDCTFRAFSSSVPTGTGDSSGREGASLFLCADVIFSRSGFQGGRGQNIYDCCAPGTDGGHGLENKSSMVALYDCRAEGFEGGWSGWGGHGGHGVNQQGPALYASGCTFVGGRGGFGDDFIWGPGGDGGDALFAAAGSSSILLDTELVPGEPGDSFLGSPGASAGAQIGGPGNVSTSGLASRHLSATNIAWPGAELGLRIEGQAGDRVRIATSPGTAYRYRANVNGVWAPELPASIEAQTLGGTNSSVVTLPASGKLTVGIEVPAPGAGSDAAPWYLQGLVISAAGTYHLTSPLMVSRLACAFSPDCNANGLPDGCEVVNTTSPDCDLNGIPDACDLAAEVADCNGNGIPDTCDLMGGLSSDCNQDEIPDECQDDCNANGVPDDCDVLSGTSADCDGNLVPDECSIDCNANGVPDLCDISGGTSQDANGNGVPDECQSPADTYYVDAASVSWGDGTLALPFDTIGQAAAYAISGNTIVVLDGTYSGAGNRNVSFDGRDLVVRSQNGPSACVIDLQSAGRAFHFSGGETQVARIEGFTIENGYTTPESLGGYAGSSILVESASPTIEGCIIRDSVSLSGGVGGSGALSFSGTLGAGAAGARVRACSFSNNGSFRGGAIAGQHTSGSLLIEDCDFSGNTAESGAALYVGAGGARTVLRGVDVRGNHSTYGGAIFQQGGDLVITQSVVAENTGGFGAGIYVANGDSFHLSHSTLAANHASPSQGGALALLDFNDSMEVRIDNCLVFANTAASIGGGMVLRDADDMRVTNCSFFLNEGTQGGGLYMEGHGIHEVRNCLFWENHASQSGAQLQVTAATTDLDYCNLQEGVNGIATSFGGTLVYGAHNSSVYPGFVDPDGADDDLSTWEDNDVRLGPNSDARDAGDNGAVPPDVLDLDGDGNTTEPVPLDLAGVARFVDSNESDTGNGSAPLVDLGCFEDQ